MGLRRFQDLGSRVAGLGLCSSEFVLLAKDWVSVWGVGLKAYGLYYSAVALPRIVIVGDYGALGFPIQLEDELRS